MKTGVSFFVFLYFTGICKGSQDMIDYLAENLSIEWSVVDNFPPDGFDGRITITNTGGSIVTDRQWRLFIPNIRLFKNIKPNGTEFGDGLGLWLTHVNGDVNMVSPSDDFQGFIPQKEIVIDFRSNDWVVSKTDVMPNWFIKTDNTEPRTIECTKGENLAFVKSFSSSNQWKRATYDNYDPYTPEERLSLFGVQDMGKAPLPIIPQPVEANLLDATIQVDNEWFVVRGDINLQFEAQFLAGKLGLRVTDPGAHPNNKYIWLRIGEVRDSDGSVINNNEAHRINSDTETEAIEIVGTSQSGVFYGVQSLLSLAFPNKKVRQGYVVDYPRFPYRGMHIDVARNFHDKNDIMRHLEAMAMYKLNKFHFHLTDDEGWRLEIPGLPELTEVGSNRCHDESGQQCISPQLGSGPILPNAGSGYLSVIDYQEVLQFAKNRHIEVIPEFDMPGHCHSSINSMVARYTKYKDSNITKAEEYLISDLEDASEYLSVQFYTDNAINPCLDSTYRFVEHLIGEIITIHKDIQPLKIFNFGGDEVPGGAWLGSPKCQTLMQRIGLNTSQELKEYFTLRIAALAHQKGLDFAGWEDGLMKGDEPYDRTSIPSTNAYGYFWDNVWEWGKGQRAYIMANADYKVILSHATHVYFDFPYEPDPEERGYYWGTRQTSTKKAFGFTAKNIYDNMDILDGMGAPINREKICSDYGCMSLQPGKESNVIGIQGQLWSETVRTSDQLDYMIFPRLLPVAERAWHAGDWEDYQWGEERDALRQADWERFTNTIGYKELARLDDLDVKYRVPPPGARFESNILKAESEHPGLIIEISLDEGRTWSKYRDGINVEQGSKIHLRTLSADERRRSRVVAITRSEFNNAGSQGLVNYMASNLQIKAKVLDNFPPDGTGALMQVQLNNSGHIAITSHAWSIYMPSIRQIKEALGNGSSFGEGYGLWFQHVNGDIYRIFPKDDFHEIGPGQTLTVNYRADAWQVSRTDFMPNWYITTEGSTPQIIKSTIGESLSFVGDFTTERQWKRSAADTYDPYTPEARFQLFNIEDMGESPLPVIPQPIKITILDESMKIDEQWIVFQGHPNVASEAQFLAEKLGIRVFNSTNSSRKCIRLTIKDVHYPNGTAVYREESYSMETDVHNEQVHITGTDNAGVFYGIQTLQADGH